MDTSKLTTAKPMSILMVIGLAAATTLGTLYVVNNVRALRSVARAVQ